MPQYEIRRLYENDAQGICDDELIDDVGYALLERCQSFLVANDAAQGRVACPLCSRIIPHRGDKAEVLRCEDCNWELTWGEYFATFQHKQLSGAEPVLELFRDFVRRFRNARGSQEKVLLIDRLIHGFHWSLTHEPTRPVAVNLIEGRLPEVIAFLDNLTYSDVSPPEALATRAQWVEKSQAARSWAVKAGPSVAPSRKA